MTYEWVAPPGRHPHDPAVERHDTLLVQVQSLLGDLRWIREYRAEAAASLEGEGSPGGPLRRRTAMGDTVGDQLRHLEGSAVAAERSARRLAELLLAGYRAEAARCPPELARAIAPEKAAATAADCLPPHEPPPPGEPGGPLTAAELRSGMTRGDLLRGGDPARWRPTGRSRRAPARTRAEPAT